MKDRPLGRLFHGLPNYDPTDPEMGWLAALQDAVDDEHLEHHDEPSELVLATSGLTR